MIRVTIDARHADGGILRHLDGICRAHPGNQSVLLTFVTSSGPLSLALPERVDQFDPDLRRKLSVLRGVRAVGSVAAHDPYLDDAERGGS